MISIMQEAMLAYVNISKPTYIVSQDLGLLNYKEKPAFKISAKQLSTRKIPMTVGCAKDSQLTEDRQKVVLLN